MANLPADPKTASTPSLPERAGHREWIGGRALTLLSHYWREDDPVEMTAAIGRDWADVLEGLPQDVIQRACIQYQREEPRRKPTPGAIYQIATKMMRGSIALEPKPATDIVGKSVPGLVPPPEDMTRHRQRMAERRGASQ